MVHHLFIHRKVNIMQINPIIAFSIQHLGKNVKYPDKNTNYCCFDKEKIDKIIAERERALPYIENVLKTTQDTRAVLDVLYILNRMLDENVKGIDKMYPVLSRFNNTNSPDVQVMLAGIYRKTLVPDAFGPLNRMLAKQIFYPNSPHFDPTEEIGGAILEYIRSYNAQQAYTK